MTKKKKEKIVEQIFRVDFNKEVKRSNLSKGLEYLKDLEFHSVVFCESKDMKRRVRRILLSPRHMKSLIESQTPECKKLKSEIEGLKAEIKLHIAKIEKHKEENSDLCRVNEQLIKNRNDKTLNAYERPIKLGTNSARFDDAAHLLGGPPLPGGLPK